MPRTIETDQESVLAMSRNQYRAHASRTKNRKFDKVVVGAAILRIPTIDSSTKCPLILLLERSPDETYYPENFEMPGGKVDESDIDIQHALVREVREETGLEVIRVLDMLPEFTYFTEKSVQEGDGTETVVKKACIQFSFVVLVEGSDIQINPAEHSMGLWASKVMLEGLEMTGEMRDLVTLALDRAESYEV